MIDTNSLAVLHLCEIGRRQRAADSAPLDPVGLQHARRFRRVPNLASSAGSAVFRIARTALSFGRRGTVAGPT